MSDLLVRLYDLNDPPPDPEGVVIRRPLLHERGTIGQWIDATFGTGWGEEFAGSFRSFPASSFIALRDGRIVGFACYEVTCRGFFGPTGVLESERGKGIGKALLLRSLLGLRDLGYAYAIIGGVGPTDFYVKTLGAIPIPGSTPGIYPDRTIRR